MALYVPQYKQKIAHTCPADEWLLGGAAGGGKTFALLNEAIAVCMEEPGATAIILRRTFPELSKIIRDSRALISSDIATYKTKDYTWEFKKIGPNGKKSNLRFGHMHLDNDIYKYQGDEFDWIGFDEATHFSPLQVSYLRSRSRTSLPDGWPRIRFASNPGNVGHRSLKDSFVRPPDEAELIAYWDFTAHRWMAFPPGTRGAPKPYQVWRPEPTEEHLQLGTTPRTRCFIPATVDDNRYIDAEYKSALLELPEAKKQALLYGAWDTYEGQFFAEFTEDTHVIDPISPQPHWPKWRGLDHGYYDPLVCIWFTMNPEDGQIIGYRELYKAGMADAEACQLIKDMTPAGEHIDYTVADPAMWRGSSNDRMINTAMVYQRYGIYLIQGNNARVQGWSRVRDLLAINPETGKPGLVFTRNCTHTIESLPTLVHSETNPEDLHDKHADSHCFVGSTEITVPGGTKQLHKIEVGDLVLTRHGYRPVVKTWLNTAHHTYTVYLSNGKTLRGTGNHPVWVEGKGFVRLDTLRYGDILLEDSSISESIGETWNEELRSSSSTESSSNDTPTRRDSATAATTSLVGPIAKAALRRFTGRFGSSITARSPRAITSTTSTAILATMPSTTSNACRVRNTSLDTAAPTRHENETAPISRLRVLTLLRGIGVRLGGSGTGNMVRLYGRIASHSSTSVSNAERRTPVSSRLTTGSALESAKPSTGETTSSTMRIGHASRAGLFSPSVASLSPATAPVSVLGITENWRHGSFVYNLTVDEHPEYFANGVLVHNCADCTRYAVMSRGSVAPRKLIRLKAGSLVH